jgi:hypothetical protein
MRFSGEKGLINYLAYINNLVIKAFLKFLSLSTYKEAFAFLNQVKEQG